MHHRSFAVAAACLILATSPSVGQPLQGEVVPDFTLEEVDGGLQAQNGRGGGLIFGVACHPLYYRSALLPHLLQISLPQKD